MLAAEDGRVLGFGEAGPGNHESVDYPGLEAALQSATAEALAQAGLKIGAITGAGFGVGGYDWPSERAQTLRSIATLGLSAPVEAVNDTILGLIAGATHGWGVAVVSGTGCNCWGWDAGHRTAHVAGAGSRMGEGAGASDLVEQVVIRISKEWSCRGPATALTQAFIANTGASGIEDLIEGIIMERYVIDASAARLVFEVAEKGDAVAREVIAWAGESLGDLANGVIRKLGFQELEFDVVMVGSLYNGGVMLIEPMRAAIQRVAPGARLVRLDTPPAVGAVLLGMEQAGFDPSACRETLIRAARQIQPAGLREAQE
jgi:N-acetylglucosamine kinase-like BadF-type ATPase